MVWNKAVFCLEVLICKRLQIWRHNYVIGRNEYLISALFESTVPWVYSLQFLFKSTHHSWRYERNCEWVLFSEHSVLYEYCTCFNCSLRTPLAVAGCAKLIGQLTPCSKQSFLSSWICQFHLLSTTENSWTSSRRRCFSVTEKFAALRPSAISTNTRKTTKFSQQIILQS